MKFLLLGKSKADNEALAFMIRSCLDPPLNATFYVYEPSAVFETDLPKDAAAAFIGIDSINEVEAAKQFARVYGEIPLVAVSGSGDYSIEAYRFGARYYIKRPLHEPEISEALRRCEAQVY